MMGRVHRTDRSQRLLHDRRMQQVCGKNGGDRKLREGPQWRFDHHRPNRRPPEDLFRNEFGNRCHLRRWNRNDDEVGLAQRRQCQVRDSCTRGETIGGSGPTSNPDQFDSPHLKSSIGVQCGGLASPDDADRGHGCIVARPSCCRRHSRSRVGE